MKVLRKSNEDEMILTFLSGELLSERFSEKLNNILLNLNLEKDILTNANLQDATQNNLRKNILKEYRGYESNSGLFENFPNITKYSLCEFFSEDLKNIFYINYSYWNELSNNTSSPLVAAKNIKDNKIVYNVSNKQYFDCLNYIENKNLLPPLILLTCDNSLFIVLEGHLRITAYSLKPELFKNVKCFVLQCSKEELEKWNPPY